MAATEPLRQDFVATDWRRGNPGLACLSDNISKMERTARPCSLYCAKEVGLAVCTFWETPV